MSSNRVKFELSFKEAYEAVLDVITPKLVPIVRSRPGAGKSAMMQLVAKDKNLKLIDIRLSQCDPIILQGLPKLTGAKAEFLPMDVFPIEGDLLPLKEEYAHLADKYQQLIEHPDVTPADIEKFTSKYCYSGWLLFFDEITNAPRAIQAAAYKIILDREVGIHKLHESVDIACAGNNVEDKAAAMEMGTALQTRLVHIHLQNKPSDFAEYMIASGWSPLIISYLEWKPQDLSNFDPNHQDYTFSCERTWEFANKLIKEAWGGKVERKHKPILAGTLSVGVANDFYSFCSLWKDLPTIEEIKNHPESVNIPSDRGTQYALAGMIASGMDEDNADALLTFVERLDQSMILLVLRMSYKTNPKIKKASKRFVKLLEKFHREGWLSN